MAAGDARAVPVRAQAYRLQFGIFKNDGTLITGATGLDSEISKDGGAFADCTNEATEIGSTGIYTLDLTTTETTATSIIVNTKSTSTGAVPAVNVVSLVTDAREVGFSPPVMFANVSKDSTTDRVPFYVYDLWGRPATGLTFSAAEIQISENGGAAASSGGTDTEVDATDFPGLYYYTPSAAETDTEGPYFLQIAKTGYVSGGAMYEVSPDVGVTNGAYDAHLVTVATNGSGNFNTVRKNTALNAWMFKMVDATDKYTAETGITVTATRSLDGAAFGACANSAAEVSNGWYKIDLAAADLNANIVVLRFTGTGCAPYEAVLVTNPT